MAGELVIKTDREDIIREIDRTIKFEYSGLRIYWLIPVNRTEMASLPFCDWDECPTA